MMASSKGVALGRSTRDAVRTYVICSVRFTPVSGGSGTTFEPAFVATDRQVARDPGRPRPQSSQAVSLTTSGRSSSNATPLPLWVAPDSCMAGLPRVTAQARDEGHGGEPPGCPRTRTSARSSRYGSRGPKDALRFAAAPAPVWLPAQRARREEDVPGPRASSAGNRPTTWVASWPASDAPLRGTFYAWPFDFWICLGL
jgi:hypothetical protein